MRKDDSSKTRDFDNCVDTKNELLSAEIAQKSFLTDTEFDTCKEVFQSACKNVQEMFKPFTKTGWYNKQKVQKIVCMTKSDLDGEQWKKHPTNTLIQVSNYGRIREMDTKNVLPQFEKNNESDGYLQVHVPQKNGQAYKEYVYKLVAETFCDKPQDNCIYDIHHINNNGYENTPENLIWLTRCQHKEIHPFMKGCTNECKK